MPKVVKLIILAAFFNGLVWIITIPIWQYPDEQAHFSQVQNLAEIGKVPTLINTSYEISKSEEILGTKRDNQGNNKYTYRPQYRTQYSNSTIGPQEKEISNLPKSSRLELVKEESTNNPPLYYKIASLGYKLFNNSDLFTRVYIARITSLIFFLALVYISYKIGKIIFDPLAGGSEIKPFVLTSAIAFKPMLVFASTGVLPDSLTNLLFSTVLYLGLLIIKRGISAKLLLLSFITLILGVLTRQNFLISIFILGFSIVIQIVKNPSYLRKIVPVLIFLVLLIIFAGTWGRGVPIISNFRFTQDSVFKLEMLSISKISQYLKFILTQSYAQILPWYFGVYKWLSLTLPPIYYQIINRLIILSLIGLALKFFTLFKNKKFDKLLILIYLLYATVIYYISFITWDYVFWYIYGFSFGIQARYFFPMIIAHIALLLIGAFKLLEIALKKKSKYAFVTLIIFIIIFNNASLFHVASSYYETSSLRTFILQMSQYKPEIFKGNILYIIFSLAIFTQALLIVTFYKVIQKYES